MAAPYGHGDLRLPARADITSATAAGASYPQAISADGRYVLVRSTATNLVPGQVDDNGASDLFLVDRTTGATTLVTHRAGFPGRTADGGSTAAAMTPDGAFVLYTSWASDLVDGVAPSAADSQDVYLWQRAGGVNSLISRRSGLAPTAAGASRAVALSPDGNWVLFESDATLDPAIEDGNGATDVYLNDRTTGASILVSAAFGSGGLATAAGASRAVAVRADGSEVLFDSDASDLLAGGSAGTKAYVRQMASGVVVAAPVAPAAAAAFTPDGRFVLLASASSVRRWDRQSGQLLTLGGGRTSAEAVAISADGDRAVFDLDGVAYLYTGGRPDQVCLSCGGDNRGAARAISADGRFAVYARFAPPGSQELVYDTVTGLSSALTRQVDGTPAPHGGLFGAMSPDGKHFAFACRDWIEPSHQDRNANFDAFHFERGVPGIDLLSRSFSPVAVKSTLGPGSRIRGQSADGIEVLFSGPSYLLDPDHPELATSAWAYRPDTGAVRLLTPLPGQPATPAKGDLQPLRVAPSGEVLVLGDSAELVPGMKPGGPLQLYLYHPTSQVYQLLTERPDAAATGTGGWISDVRFDGALSRVVFKSNSSDLVPAATGLAGTALFSCGTDGSGCQLLVHDVNDLLLCPNRPVSEIAATSDLATVVFSTAASNLVASGTNGAHLNLFAWRAGGVTLISRQAGATGQANGETLARDISADGRFVLATSSATDLASGVTDANGSYDVYLYDSLTGTWQLVSSRAADRAVAAGGRGLDISADGRYVLFASQATDLVPGQIDVASPIYPPIERLYDLFLFDRLTGEKRLVSHLPGRQLEATGFTAYGILSEDGNRVVMLQTEKDYNSAPLLLWERDGGSPRLLAESVGGPFLYPGFAMLSFVERGQPFDGRHLLFDSFNENLMAGDGNDTIDGFVLLVDNLFRDGFESGDTGAWSVTSP